MKLVALVASLFPTSIIKCNINGLTRFSRGLLRLFFEIKQQGLKKRNKNNACLLVALVAPTGNAAANKRRPPGRRQWGFEEYQNTKKSDGGNRPAVAGQFVRNDRPDFSGIPQRRYFPEWG